MGARDTPDSTSGDERESKNKDGQSEKRVPDISDSRVSPSVIKRPRPHKRKGDAGGGGGGSGH